MLARPRILLLLIGGMLAGCGKAERELRIVTLTDLTGSRAVFGQGIRMGAALALEKQRAALAAGGWRIELAAFDISSSSQDLSNAVSRIAAQPDTVCAIVHGETSTVLIAASILHTGGIPTVLPAETASFTGRSSPPELLWLSPDDPSHGASDADWAAGKGVTSAFLLIDREEHAQAVGEGFQLRAEKLGLSISTFSLSPGQESPAWIPSFLSAPPPLIYFSGSSESVASILSRLEVLGFQGSFFFAQSEAGKLPAKDFFSDKFPLFYSSATADTEDFSRTGEFADAFRNAYGSDPPPLSDMGFEAATYCLQPLVGKHATDLDSHSPRTWIISEWHAGAAFEGSVGASLMTGQRPCRIEVFTYSKYADPIWIPDPLVKSINDTNLPC